MKKLAPFLIAALVFGGIAIGAPALQRLSTIFASGITIGSTGTAISLRKCVTASQQFASTPAGYCANSTNLALVGATVGNLCRVMGNQGADGGSAIDPAADVSCYVSAADVVTIKFCARSADAGALALADAGYTACIEKN